jgi:chromosome segregation ATPase
MPSQVTSPRPASPAVKFAETVESLKAERAVNGFFDFMATVQSKSSYQYLRDLFQTKIELEKKCDDLSQAYTTHTKMYAQVQAALGAATERSKEKDSELDKLKKEKVDTNKKIESLEKELRDSKDAESRLRTTLDKKNSQIEGLSKSVEEKKSLVQSAKDGEKKAKGELKTCQEELNQARLAKGKKETELSELRKFTSDMAQIPQKDM